MAHASVAAADTRDDADLKVRPRTIQRQAVEKLRSAIMAGRFRPGDRLVEMDLCDLLGISRPSVREALRSLEAERLVSIIPNRGPQIPILTVVEASEIYQVRALLEGEAAALCAQRPSAERTRAMRAALTRFGRAVRSNDPEERLASTADFYAEILLGCGNHLIGDLLGGLHARINFLRYRSMSLPGRAKLSLQEMKGILSAIESGDAAAARMAAVHHVEQAHSFAKASYETEPGDASPAQSGKSRSA